MTLKRLNQINWIFAFILALIVIPILLSSKLVFIPEQELLKPAKLISVAYFVFIVGISVYLRVTKSRAKSFFKKSNIFELKVNGDPVFTKEAPKLFENEFNSWRFTYFVIPFFGLFFALTLFLGLVSVAPAFHTMFNGKSYFEQTKLIDKRMDIKRRFTAYSLSLDGFEKEIDVSRSIYNQLEVNDDLKIQGKISRFGIMIEEFE